jgi:hypothetical protein
MFITAQPLIDRSALCSATACTGTSGRASWRLWAAATIALLLVAENLLADSFRCGRKVVRSGDSQSEVLAACGEPQRRESKQESLWLGSSQKNVRVKAWYYKRSSRKLERIVLIYQGKVVAVRTGGR